MQSHPMWVRGLKQGHQPQRQQCRRSHPTWVCGLKLCIDSYIARNVVSHPARVRGLPCMIYASAAGVIALREGYGVKPNSAEIEAGYSVAYGQG